jgi:hypothetical protein
VRAQQPEVSSIKLTVHKPADFKLLQQNLSSYYLHLKAWLLQIIVNIDTELLQNNNIVMDLGGMHHFGLYLALCNNGKGLVFA